ncbi:response regulator [Pseudodesulfovibrio sp. F-1]|uniref:Response regulator n=1 Tax=Pseudodesulfovibrio alkaliphilus TaxID=2661613 RepID=A0A7K1KLF1_9BACT|nr:response regulator [Pseudodesulfovibrio alkaliphilus]MUM76781.1 response regulator [Pseudodesulfovibrio alkaliphilus]
MNDNGDILIIDDDEKLRALLTEYLEGYGFGVRTLPSGDGAVDVVRSAPPGLVILDVMMPGRNGLDVLRDIRGHSRVPVIMLTAKGEDTDRIVGLELGADDYLPKPFNPRELLARIKAVLRRLDAPAAEGQVPAQRPVPLLEAGGLTLNLARQVLLAQGAEVELSATEFRLLRVLMENPDTAMTRDELMTLAWDRDFSAYDRSIDVHISKLRSLLRSYPAHARRIRTVWGTGYLFVGAE